MHFFIFRYTTIPHSSIFYFVILFKLFFDYIEEIQLIDKHPSTMKKDNTIFYQEKLHHRQNLRSGINQQVYQDLEVNENPSAVSRKVYKSLYQEEMEQSPQHIIKNKASKGDSVFMNAGLRISEHYPDYHEDKYAKIQQHISHNLDGGKGFYQASDSYVKNIRQKNFKDMKQTLQNQLKQKQLNNLTSQNQKLNQNQKFNQTLQQYRQMVQQEQQEHKKMKQNTRVEQIELIRQQEARKHRNSTFQMNNISRHNPITNPIQCRIDNPYILQQIQKKKLNERITHH